MLIEFSSIRPLDVDVSLEKIRKQLREQPLRTAFIALAAVAATFLVLSWLRGRGSQGPLYGRGSPHQGANEASKVKQLAKDHLSSRELIEARVAIDSQNVAKAHIVQKVSSLPLRRQGDDEGRVQAGDYLVPIECDNSELKELGDALFLPGSWIRGLREGDQLELLWGARRVCLIFEAPQAITDFMGANQGLDQRKLTRKIENSLYTQQSAYPHPEIRRQQLLETQKLDRIVELAQLWQIQEVHQWSPETQEFQASEQPLDLIITASTQLLHTNELPAGLGFTLYGDCERLLFGSLGDQLVVLVERDGEQSVAIRPLSEVGVRAGQLRRSIVSCSYADGHVGLFFLPDAQPYAVDSVKRRTALQELARTEPLEQCQQLGEDDSFMTLSEPMELDLHDQFELVEGLQLPQMLSVPFAGAFERLVFGVLGDQLLVLCESKERQQVCLAPLAGFNLMEGCLADAIGSSFYDEGLLCILFKDA